jgi:hypothetical protein
MDSKTSSDFFCEKFIYNIFEELIGFFDVLENAYELYIIMVSTYGNLAKFLFIINQLIIFGN